jgi:DNA polymerase III epsilon subunit-like protein
VSRIRRLSHAISEEGRRSHAMNQALRIRESALSVVEQANSNANASRRITKKAAFTVVLRSLQATRHLPFSLREHMALKELTQYINLAQNNKTNSLTLSHTDLLPISHPRSTRDHSLTASALESSRARWFVDDPRITDDRARVILASALTSEFGSVEHTYYNSILSGLPQGTLPTETLLAAMGDGNSPIARSLRAKLQRRDRKGRFAYQGGGLRALVRRGGKVFSVVGKTLMDSIDGENVLVELPDGRIAKLPPAKGEFVKAILNPTADGFSKAPVRYSSSDDVINEEDIEFVEAPDGWEKIEDNFWSNGEWQVSKNKDGNFAVMRDVPEIGKQEFLQGNFKSWSDILDKIDEIDKPSQKAALPDKEQVSEPEALVKPALPGKEMAFEFAFPEGAKKVSPDSSYDPEGRVDEESTDFTDDPVELAQKYDPRDLVAALEEAVIPKEDGENATGYGTLGFNNGDEFVPAEALYFALQEAGEDAPLELAKIYDKKLGTNQNEEALADFRKGAENVTGPNPDIAEAFERTIDRAPEEVPAAEIPDFNKEEMDLVPLPVALDGLGEAEMAQFMETKDHTPFLPKNDDIEMPVGYHKVNPAPYQNWKEVTEEDQNENLPVGFSDNPVFLAQSIEKAKLVEELKRGIEPGNPMPGHANVSMKDDDGEEFVANVPVEAVRDALQLLGEDTNALIKSIADEGFAGQEEQQAELPLDLPTEAKPMNAYERLMAEQAAERKAIEDRIAELKANAEARVDDQGRPVPEGWGISQTAGRIFGRPLPENYNNVYGLNNFEASTDKDGNITVKDRNGLVEPKTYANWDEVQADLDARKAEYAKASREKIKEFAKGYGFSDEQIAAFDSMTQAEIADFFANPDNHTEAYKSALDDFETSWAVDMPRPAQRERWAAFGKEKRISEQAGDFPDGNAPVAELPVASERKPGTATEGEANPDVKAMLDEEEALADKLQAEEDMPRGDAQAVAETEMKKKYGKTALEALNELPRDEALKVLEEREKGLDIVSVPENKNIRPAAPDDFEVDGLQEIPDGFEEYPAAANVAPAPAPGDGGDGPTPPGGDTKRPPIRITVKAKDILPGDITVGDHFVITEVGEKVPGTDRIKIKGYYPGHVEQDTKQWNEWREIPVIRGAVAPDKGDLPVLSKPKEKDFGRRKKNADGSWGFAKAEDQAAFDAARADYDIQLDAAKKRFVDPTEAANQPHRVISRAADLKAGDVTTDPKKGHFVIERIFVDENTKAEFVSVEGYYPGHVTQRKEWKANGPIDVIRNVEPPAKGDLEELHQPHTVVDGKWRPDKDPAKRAEHQKKLDEAAALWQAPADLPVINQKDNVAEQDKDIPNAVAVRRPTPPRQIEMPAFQGDMAAIAREAGGDWNKFRELLKDKDLVFFDFETTGVNPEDGNEPWQVAGVRVRNGEIVDRVNIFMNPGRSIADTYAGRDTDGIPNAVDDKGNKLNDDFLGQQPNQEDAMRQFLEWAGPNAIFGAQNMVFDEEVARRLADRHGLDWAPGGLLDVLPMARDIYKDQPKEDRPKTLKGRESYALGNLAKHLGIDLENWHAADADAEAAAKIFNALIDKGIELDAGKDLFDVDARNDEYVAKMDGYIAARELYDGNLAEFAAAKALADGIWAYVDGYVNGKGPNLDDVIKDATGVPNPGENIDAGPVGLEPEPVRARDEVVVLDFTPNTMFPQGKMRMMDRDWVLNPDNAVLLPRENIRMRELLPGDFMSSKDGNTIWQVVAVRGGEEFGLEPGKVRVYRRNIENGEVSTYEHFHGVFLDGVRRPKNPEDLNVPEVMPEGEAAPFIANAPVDLDKNAEKAEAERVWLDALDLPGVGIGTIIIDKTPEGKFALRALIHNSDGDEIYRVEEEYRTAEGAKAEGEALLNLQGRDLLEQNRKEQAEPEEARAKDVPIARGDIPGDANNAPQIIEVQDLPGNLAGDIKIQNVGDEKPDFQADAVVRDLDGDLLANQTTNHPDKVKAEKEGREFIARVVDALQNPEKPAEEESKKKREPKPLSEDAKAKIEEEKAKEKDNAWVEENGGRLAPIEAIEIQKGDFLWEPFWGNYAEVLDVKYIGVMDRVEFNVLNRVNGKIERRFLKADSPIRNVRRPGVEDQEFEIVDEPKGTRAVPGAKRGQIKRKALEERVIAKEGRPMGGRYKEEGFYEDKNGIALQEGDVVRFKDPVKDAKWGRGVVKARIGAQVEEGKKAGGQGRKGIIYLDKLVIQFEGEEDKWAIRQGGRELKAKNLILQNGDNADIVLPDFRGPKAKPVNRGLGVEGPGGRVVKEPEAAPVIPDAAPDDRFAVPLIEPVVRKDKNKDLEEQIRRAIDAGDEISFNYNGKTRYVKPVKVWENPQNGNVNITAIENGEVKNFTIGKMDYIADPEGAAIERPEVEKVEPLGVAFELDDDNIKNGLEEIRKGIKKLNKGGRITALKNAEVAIDNFVRDLDVKDHRGMNIKELDALLRRLRRTNGTDDLVAAVEQLKNIVEPEKQRLELDFERKMFDEINNPLEAVVADAKTINAANVKEVIDEIAKRLPDSARDGAAYRLSIARNYLMSYAKGIDTDDDLLYADPKALTEAISYLEGLPIDVSGIKKQLQDLNKSVKGYAKNNKKPFGKANMPFIDPLALQEQRVADGVNKFDLANAQNLKALIADDQVFADNPFAAPYKEELQNFFAQEGEVPLAALSVDARQALSQLVSSEIRKPGAGSTDDKKVRANEYARMIMGLHEEKLAFNPNRDDLGPAGEALKDIDFMAVFNAGQRLGTDKPTELEINGQPTGFRIQRIGDGINQSYNFRLIHKDTGQIFYFKRERSLETADAEYASNQLARALNIAGVPVVVRHNNDAQVLIMSNAGDSLEFEKDPTIAANAGQNYADVAARAAVADLIAFGILDAVIANSDRHSHNFLLGSVDRGNVDGNDREEIQILPIDHGFAQLFQNKRINNPLDYMSGGDGRDGGQINKALARDIGAATYKELIDMTIQQAIQAIERGDYLADVKPADKQAIIDRLLVLKGIDVDKWKSNLAKKL